jgi:predicted hydrocarbon binding protein
VNSLSAKLMLDAMPQCARESASSTLIPDMELGETIRFAVKATKELDPSDFRSQRFAIAKLGVELGHEVAKSLGSGEKRDVYGELASFWSRNGLGSMMLMQTAPAVIRLNRCLDCNAPGMGDSQFPCTFKSSLLETIFQDSLGTKVKVHELECCKRGGTGCVFRLKVG